MVPWVAHGVSQKTGCGVLQSLVEVGGSGVGGGLRCGGRGSSSNTPTQSPSSSLSASQLTLVGQQRRDEASKTCSYEDIEVRTVFTFVLQNERENLNMKDWREGI